MTDVLDFAKRLIAAPSVTPATGAVFDALEAMLAPLGFKVTRFTRGEGAAGTPEAPVENLFAIRRGPEGSRGTWPLPAISTSSRPVAAGPARRSNPKCAASCSTAAARST